MIEKLKAAAMAIWAWAHSKEPAIVIGALVSIGAAVQQGMADAGVTEWSWKVIAPILLAAIIRQFVVSPATSQSREAAARLEAESAPCS